MKIAIIAALSMLFVGACGTESAGPTEPEEAPEGLTLERVDETFATGTYRVAETTIRFEAVVENQLESVRFLTPSGQEVFRSEIYGTPEERTDPTTWGMWHYGVQLDSAKTADDQPEFMQWINSAEGQLAASLWRDIASAHPYETGPLHAAWRYGVHLDEAMAFDREGLEDTQEANCNCYGKCGPGCFSVGSNSYCRKHDCCCRTYGSAACYTWCFVNPKCPVAICNG